jgi:hypothetical protein
MNRHAVKTQTYTVLFILYEELVATHLHRIVSVLYVGGTCVRSHLGTSYTISSHPQRMNTKVGNVDFILVNTNTIFKNKINICSNLQCRFYTTGCNRIWWMVKVTIYSYSFPDVAPLLFHMCVHHYMTTIYSCTLSKLSAESAYPLTCDHLCQQL